MQLTSGGGQQVCTFGFIVVTADNSNGVTANSAEPTDGACPAYYMPIDRINDHVSIRVLTTVGAVDPN